MGENGWRNISDKNQIEIIAYRLWENAGRPESDGIEFWLKAEMIWNIFSYSMLKELNEWYGTSMNCQKDELEK